MKLNAKVRVSYVIRVAFECDESSTLRSILQSVREVVQDKVLGVAFRPDDKSERTIEVLHVGSEGEA